MTILIVDDDPAIRKLLRRTFEMESYTVLEAANGEEMFKLLKDHPVELITLDLSLGGEDGLDLAREIRRSSDIGIIMVSGRDDLVDTVVGLEVGADDYITKPFEIREVLARVRTVLRRSRSSKETRVEQDDTHYRFKFGNWTLDPGTRELRDSENNLRELTTSEYDLLEILVRHAKKTLSRDQIMDQMKGCDWSPNDRSIDNHVARLRKKMSCDSNDSPIIKTVRGAGYLFTADVTRI
ncbi:MAG: response regulator transcription factor [Granulosicoccus sp.]|nr:response regulator transcription factor [Granulosicoccus sp.]